MFDFFVVSLILSGVALLVSAFVAVAFFRTARDNGKEAASWAAIGWGTYIAAGVVAGKLLFLGAWLWERGSRVRPDIALGDIFRTSWFLEAVPFGDDVDPSRLLALLCALKLAMIAIGLLAAELTARLSGLKKPAGFDHQAKTVSFLGAAAALALVVWATVPATLGDDAVFGRPLFPALKHEAVTAVEIVKFNEEKASEHELAIQKLTPRKVAELLELEPPKGDDADRARWFIASHSYYPLEAKGLTEQEKKDLLAKDEDENADEADAKPDADGEKTEAKDDDKQKAEAAEQRAAQLRRKSQLAQALSGLVGLRIEDVAGSSPGDHAEFGVVDPKTRKEGSRGCGTRVVLKGADDAPLLALIVGKAVPNRPSMRYVRHVDDDTVFVTQVDPKVLPVRFSAWIEADLLKLNELHARRLDLLDFDFDSNGRREPRTERHLALASDDGNAWRLAAVGDAQPETIPDGKEVDPMKVSGLLGDLRNLEIIDVRRKPALLGKALRGEPVPQSMIKLLAKSLAEHGFLLGQDLYPRDGEIHCQMDDGVRYVLKFGSLAPTSELAAKELDELLEKQVAGQTDKADDTRKSVVDVVRTQLKVPEERTVDNQTKLADLATVDEEDVAPPGKDGETKEEKNKKKEKAVADRVAALRQGIDSRFDVEILPAAYEKIATVGQLIEEVEKAVKDRAKTRYLFVMVDLNEQVAEAHAKKEAAKGKDSKADENADKAAEDDHGEAGKDDKAKPAAKKLSAEEKQIFDRSHDRANELNARFAEWYYVISNKTYQKLHVPLDKLLRDKQPEKPPAGDGHDHGPDDDHGAGEKPPAARSPLQEFDALKRDGLQ